MNQKLLLAAALAVGALLASPFGTKAAGLETEQFIRSSDGTVYWLAANERRYVFPDGATLQSWLGGTQGMLNDAPDEILEEHPVGGPMTMRPGTRLVRFASDPTTYVVTRGAVLREVSAPYAQAYYGNDWQEKVDTLSITLFSNYKRGNPISSLAEFDREAEISMVPTPERDLELRRANGLLPKSTKPFKADVAFRAVPVEKPNAEPTAAHFTVTVDNQTSAVTNLRVDMFREEGNTLTKTCRGIDRCHHEIDYAIANVSVTERYYAVVSNDIGEKLPPVFSPSISYVPNQAE